MIKRKNRYISGRAGFTLVEVMAALLIMGMVLTVAGGILVSTLQARKQIQETFKKTNEGIAIIQMMTRDISASMSAQQLIKSKKDDDDDGDGNGDTDNDTSNNSDGENRRFFYGQNDGSGPFARDSLDFVTTEDTWDPDTQTFADFSECGYLLKQNPDKPDLYRLYRRSDPWIDEDPVRGGTLTKLHDHVVGLDIEYLKEGEENQQDTWVNSWDDTKKETKGLPLAVRITLVLRYIPEDEDDEGQETNSENDREFTTLISLRE